MPDQTLLAPCLFVDLGNAFSAGHAAHMEFRLICAGYQSSPTVRATLSAVLDADNWNPSPRSAQDGPGHWSFTQNFLLNRGGNPCPPGRYEMHIDVAFPFAPANSLGRFLWARIPFQVVDSKETMARRLEILVDDCGAMDARGIDFSQYGDVRIKVAKSAARIEGLSPTAPDPVGQPTAPRKAAEGEYIPIALKRDLDRAAELPVASTVIPRGPARQKIMLALPDGRRIILMAQDSLKVGRDRFKENDVLLRWIPVTVQNKALTESISKEHFQLKLSAKGMEIEDLGSQNGTIINGVALGSKRPKLVEASGARAEITVAGAFRLLLRTYSTADAEQQNLVPPDQFHCDGVGVATLPPLWNRAVKAQIEAARLERIGNLPNEEYVLLFRQLVLGPGAHCPIRLPADDGYGSVARIIHAGGQFWLERLTEQLSIAIDGHELGRRELAPLLVNQALQLGDTRVIVSEPQQDLSRQD